MTTKLAAAHGHDPRRGCILEARGILHLRCNGAFGLFVDDPARLIEVATYMTRRRR